MVREAANAPDVLSIRITIYRLARKAKLVDYLCAAAENSKDVTVLIELRARFDEQNNIDWSERLEEAGCKVLYGFEGLQGSFKICLITLRERSALRHVTQIGTQAIITRRPQSSTRTSPLSQPTRASVRTPLPSSAIWRLATLRAATARCSLRRTS